MSGIRINDMDENSQYFVSACTHCNESQETDSGAEHRLAWLSKIHGRGAKTKVALMDNTPVGFIHIVPIELTTLRLIGKDLYVIPCLAVSKEWEGKGISKALVEAAENEARRLNTKALVTLGYYGEYPFMPAKFFENLGYEVVTKRKVFWAGDRDILDEEVMLWKVFDSAAESPQFGEPKYEFRPLQGKVVVDLFVNPLCLTSVVEADRVREVVQEFEDEVVLNEYGADDREKFLSLLVPRGIFVDGEEIGWGYAAPKEGIREAITGKL